MEVVHFADETEPCEPYPKIQWFNVNFSLTALKKSATTTIWRDTLPCLTCKAVIVGRQLQPDKETCIWKVIQGMDLFRLQGFVEFESTFVDEMCVTEVRTLTGNMFNSSRFAYSR
eukprot:984488-Pyramimonas_sp.AAC.1